MKRIWMLILVVLLASCSSPVVSQVQVQTCLEYLKSRGIEANPIPIEEVQIVLPEHFDPVYEHYEEMIAKDGFSLIPYLGKEVTRITFTVTNYPDRPEVRANFLCYQNSIIGGDLSTVSFYGFMHSFADFPS